METRHTPLLLCCLVYVVSAPQELLWCCRLRLQGGPGSNDDRSGSNTSSRTRSNALQISALVLRSLGRKCMPFPLKNAFNDLIVFPLTRDLKLACSEVSTDMDVLRGRTLQRNQSIGTIPFRLNIRIWSNPILYYSQTWTVNVTGAFLNNSHTSPLEHQE